MAAPAILVIEDDPAIRRGLADALAAAGYTAHEAADGGSGLDLACSLDLDLVLLDLILPRRDGLEVLKTLRGVRPILPVIVLTARGEEEDRVEGLQLGADDYVVKPFSVRELLARVQAVLRRSPERPTDVAELPLPGGVADLERREVRLEDGCRRALSEREVELLRYLACNPRRAVSREELMARVWGIDPRGVTSRTIDMHVARLREKLEPEPGTPRVLLTVRGKGYMLSLETSGSNGRKEP